MHRTYRVQAQRSVWNSMPGKEEKVRIRSWMNFWWISNTGRFFIATAQSAGRRKLSTCNLNVLCESFVPDWTPMQRFRRKRNLGIICPYFVIWHSVQILTGVSTLICIDLPRFTGAEPCRGRPDGNCRTRGAGAAEDNLGRAGNVRGTPSYQ